MVLAELGECRSVTLLAQSISELSKSRIAIQQVLPVGEHVKSLHGHIETYAWPLRCLHAKGQGLRRYMTDLG